MLARGIAVVGAVQLAGEGALFLSHGTQRAEPSPDRFVENAWVPHGPWRQPTARELEALAGEAPPGATVELLRPESGAACRAADLAREALLEHDRAPTSAARASLHDASQALLTELLAQHGPFRWMSEVRLAEVQPGLLTSTRDPSQENRLLGLHVDSHDRLPLERRLNSRRLVVANLGSHPRSLLFVNLALAQLDEALLRDRTPRGRNDSATELGRAFLAHYPTYPVVRLLIRPRQAYLAPVQNMVHDGSTLDLPGTDRTARAFGEFDRSAQDLPGKGRDAVPTRWSRPST